MLTSLVIIAFLQSSSVAFEYFFSINILKSEIFHWYWLGNGALSTQHISISFPFIDNFIVCVILVIEMYLGVFMGKFVLIAMKTLPCFV